MDTVKWEECSLVYEVSELMILLDMIRDTAVIQVECSICDMHHPHELESNQDQIYTLGVMGEK